MLRILPTKSKLLSGVATLSLMLTATGVMAQEQQPAEESHSSPQLIDVIVTVAKRAQTLNSVGVTAISMNGDRIKDVGIKSPVDIGAFTPGLVTVNSTSGGTPIFAIRGIGLDDFSPNNSSGVGIYTNEVFASNPAFLNGLLFDINRLEVLKGPQGTLYGFNTTGGAVNFITNKPTDDLSASAELGYGRFNEVEFEGALSGTLTDGVRGRIATKITNSDGWQTDADTGRKFGGDDKMGFRGMLDFDLGEGTTALVEAHYSKDTSTPVSPQVQGLGDFFEDASFDAMNTPLDARAVTVGDLDVMRDEEGFGGSLTINSSFDFADVLSITSYDKYDRHVVDNYGGSAGAILDFEQNNKFKQFSQELRLVSNSTGAFSWIAGANIASFSSEVRDIFDDTFLVTDSAAVNFVLDPNDIPATGDDLIIGDYLQETTSLGVYFHTETELSDDFKIIAGLRYTNDKRSFVGDATNDSFGETFDITSLNDEFSEDRINWKVGLDWNATPDTLIYANVATSYKAATYYGAAVLDDAAWSYIKPEDVVSYEIGFKQSLFDSSMQLNAAAFRMDYKDRQSLVAFTADDFSNFLLIPIVDTTLINIPKSVSQGFEVELRWLPAEGWDVTAGLAYLDSKITQGPSGAIRGIALDPAINDNATGDLDGDGEINNGEVGFVDAMSAPLDSGRLSQAPKFSYNFVISYETDITDELVGRAQIAYSYAGDQLAQLSDINALYGPISSLDGQLSLKNEDNGWKVTLWAKNLTNNDAENYAFSSFAGRAAYRQKPVSYGVRFGYEF